MPRSPSASGWGARRLVRAERRIEELQKIGPQPWVYVGTFPDDPFTRAESPPWENSYTHVTGRRVAFRWGFDGSLDMVGQFDLTAGAVSGDVAFTLPPEYIGEWFDGFIPLELAAGVWSAAVISINGDNGEVILYWPIVADPIP